MRKRTIRKAGPVLAGLLFAPLYGFSGDYATAPFAGAAVVTNGVFSNLYLFPDPTKETWDQHLVKLHKKGDPFLAETVAAIDQFTTDLTNSSYFDTLAQYGVNPPLFLGHVPTLQACVDAAIKDIKPNKAFEYGTLKEFAACERNAGAGVTDQVNIFVSPEFNVLKWGQSTPMCGSGGTGYHGWALNDPNFTVVPLNTACNPDMASLTQVLSHEMVETISDPAGFGYIHETGTTLRFLGDPASQFDKGELGDICERNGLKNPNSDPNIIAIPFFDTGLRVSRYWSNVDDSCQPAALMNRTWLNLFGNPVIRFTGGVHELKRSIDVPAADQGMIILSLRVLIWTGDDDLRGGGNDNCDVVIQLRSGEVVHVPNLNRNKSWGNNELHSALLPLPAGTRAGDLFTFTLHTGFIGGFAGDNWNVNQVLLQGAVGGPQETLQTVIDSRANPLIRFTGDIHDLDLPALPAGFHASDIIRQVRLTIDTGGDDLRGGDNDNCDLTINLNGGGQFSFPNVNQGQHWNNGEKHTLPLKFPDGVKLGDITGIRLHTHFTGGFDGDNWNVDAVLLQVDVLGFPAAGTFLTAVSLMAVRHAADMPFQSVSPCKAGTVRRGAAAYDPVCVTPAVRAAVLKQNREAAGRRVPDAIVAGPDTCQTGFVWRLASEADHVCVLPKRRADVANENKEASIHRAPPDGTGLSLLDGCVSGYAWRMTGPRDHVCVTPVQRALASADEMLSRKASWVLQPGGCLRAYVPRGAQPGDQVCVTPGERAVALGLTLPLGPENPDAPKPIVH